MSLLSSLSLSLSLCYVQDDGDPILTDLILFFLQAYMNIYSAPQWVCYVRARLLFAYDTCLLHLHPSNIFYKKFLLVQVYFIKSNITIYLYNINFLVITQSNTTVHSLELQRNSLSEFYRNTCFRAQQVAECCEDDTSREMSEDGVHVRINSV